jgi:23S rRNA pseudouridine1911/1915/1917 synthase
MGVSPDRPSLVGIAKHYLKHKYNKPGHVYLGVVSRLDAPVTGLVLLAKTSKAAARLAELLREGQVEKTYWAVVEGRPHPSGAQCVDWVFKDERQRRMRVVGPDHPGAQEARLRYRALHPLGPNTWVEVELETGRKHQIRLQLAARGWPVLGDRKYGATQPFNHGIALHARGLRLVHPVRKTNLELTAPLPADWKRLGVNEGGEGPG